MKKKKDTFNEIVPEDQIEWIICPHCRGKVYGKTQMTLSFSWESNEKGKKK